MGLNIPKILLYIPIVNVVYLFIIGIVNKIGQVLRHSIGNHLMNFADSNLIGDIWLFILAIIIILIIFSFIHGNFGKHQNKDYNILGILCIASIFCSLVIIYYLFS